MNHFARACTAALLLSPAAYAAPPALVPDGAYTQAQELVPIDGARRLNLFCLGTGSPIVLLDAGSGGTTLDWRHVQGQIARTTRTCAYDRAGAGYSDGATRPSTIANTVDDLHRLIRSPAIGSPVIYVGHSVAGLFGLYLEVKYPADVLGAVLVDPAFPSVFDRLVAALPPADRPKEYALFQGLQAQQAACNALAERGALKNPVTQSAKDCVDPSGYPDTLDPALDRALAAEAARPEVEAAMASGVSLAFPLSAKGSEYDAEMAAVHPSFGNKKLIVLTEGNGTPIPPPSPAGQAAMTAAWRAGHQALVKLSTRGQDIVVPGTGHYIQIQAPQAVVDAVVRVVTTVRG